MLTYTHRYYFNVFSKMVRRRLPSVSVSLWRAKGCLETKIHQPCTQPITDNTIIKIQLDILIPYITT